MRQSENPLVSNARSNRWFMFIPELDRCTVTGEPHYNTFSQCPLNYQGVCKHLLSAPTSRYTGLNNFTIFLKNQYKDGRNKVAFVLYVEILWRFDVIRLTRDLSATCRTNVPVIVTVMNWKWFEIQNNKVNSIELATNAFCCLENV
jgi:hypothetical protein